MVQLNYKRGSKIKKLEYVMKFKYGTIESLYSKNSTLLLSELLKISGNKKVFITYGENSIINTGELKIFNIINISRHEREYKGFLNSYRTI
jgi:hypothetical protein